MKTNITANGTYALGSFLKADFGITGTFTANWALVTYIAGEAITVATGTGSYVNLNQEAGVSRAYALVVTSYSSGTLTVCAEGQIGHGR